LSRNICTAEKLTKSPKKIARNAPLEQCKDAQARHQPAQHDARCQPPHDIPAHRAALVVSADAGNRGEHDGGHGGGNRHLDGEIRCHLLVTQDVGHERHQQHATADAQQTCEKTGAQAKNSEFNNQKGFEHHAKESGCGVHRICARCFCADGRERKVSASAAGPAS